MEVQAAPLFLGRVFGQILIRYVTIQVALLHISRVNSCKEVCILVLNHNLQLTALLLPEQSSLAKINGLPSNHFRKAAIIFEGHIAKGFYVNYLVFALIGVSLVCSKSLVAHLGVQNLKAGLKIASKSIVVIANEMAIVISHFHIPLSRAVK